MSARTTTTALALTLMLGACHAPTAGHARGAEPLRTIAVRVHHTDAMLAFYRAAFGVEFREEQTGPVRSHFGELGGVTLKFVPIRAAAEFDDYPSHQLGVAVDDVAAVVALATAHGGRPEGELRVEDGRTHGCVRDPDGNTIELYGPR